MENMIRSMARFSAAMTLFGFQQFQNVLDAVADSADALKIRKSLDAVTDAVASELDDHTKPAYDSMVRLTDQVVDRTFDSLKRRPSGSKSADQAAGKTAEQQSAAGSEGDKVELAAD